MTPSPRTARRLAALFISGMLALVGAVALDPGPAAAQGEQQALGGDRDCGDFGSQASAQNFFLNHGGPDRDPHGLDSDGDGIACESNPCPCNYDTGGGGGGGGDGGGGGGGGNPGPETLRQKGNVVRVIDGDTVVVNLKNGPRRHVRILGIDTPEVFGGEECGGRQASRSARQFMPRGSFVLLISDTTQRREDRYNRLLRYVHKRNNFDVGRAQLRRGWASVYVYNNDPFKRVRAYRQTQSDARQSDRGMWGLC